MNIIPTSVPPSTIAEFDMNFLRDHLRSDVFINGRPTGFYAVTVLPDEMEVV